MNREARKSGSLLTPIRLVPNTWNPSYNKKQLEGISCRESAVSERSVPDFSFHPSPSHFLPHAPEGLRPVSPKGLPTLAVGPPLNAEYRFGEAFPGPIVSDFTLLPPSHSTLLASHFTLPASGRPRQLNRSLPGVRRRRALSPAGPTHYTLARSVRGRSQIIRFQGLRSSGSIPLEERSFQFRL